MTKIIVVEIFIYARDSCWLVDWDPLITIDWSSKMPTTCTK